MAAVFVFTTAVVVYAWTASPALGWLDAPEFVAAAASLGVPHSPGHPVPVMIGRLGSLLPIGDIALRVNLMSSVAAAGAVTAFYFAGRRICGCVARDVPERVRTLAAAGCALGLGFTWTVWFQGVRAEVYALEGLFMAGTLAAVLSALPLADGSRDARAAPDSGLDMRWLAAAGLFVGLGLSTHHFITLTVLAPAAALLLGRRLGVRRTAVTSLCIALGLAGFLYLPVRSAAHPEVNWGAPHTAQRFAWTVSARAFHKTATQEQLSSRTEYAVQAVATLGQQATWPVLFAALLGLYLGVRRRRFRRAALLLAGVLVLGVGGRALLGFDPRIPDDHGYILPATGALFLLALAGLAGVAQALYERAPERARAVRVGALVPLVVLAILPPLQLARFQSTASLAHAHVSDRVAHWELSALPPRTLLLPAYFQTSFRLWALRTTEGARPDIAVLDRSFLSYPGAAGEARRAYPDLVGLIDAPLRAGVSTPIEELRALSRERAVAVQLHTNLEPAVDPWLLPAGPFFRVIADPVSESVRQRAEQADARAHARLFAFLRDAPRGDMRGLRDALLWYDYLRASVFCRQQRSQAAQRTLAEALQLAPRDVTLLELAASCGVSIP